MRIFVPLGIVLVFFLFSSFINCSKPAVVNVKEVVWSFDNKSALVIIERDSEKTHEIWLTDKELEPIQCLASPSSSWYACCFSRDSNYLYFMVRNEEYKVPEQSSWQILRRTLRGEQREEHILTLDSPAIYMVAGMQNDLYILELTHVRNLYRWDGRQYHPLLSKPAPGFLVPALINVSHKDCIMDGKARLYVRVGDEKKSTFEKLIWSIPLDMDNIKHDDVLKEHIAPDLYRQSADGKIKLYVADGKETTIRFLSGKRVDGLKLRNCKLDWKEIVWIGPEDGFLWRAGGNGEAHIVFKELPERIAALRAWNEFLGIVCIETSESLYIIHCDTGRVREVSKKLFLKAKT